MKAKIEVIIKHTYSVEIEISDYSEDETVEGQAAWLLKINGDSKALYGICKEEVDPYTAMESSIKVIK